MTVKIKIYLNDGEDHFFGFVNDFANNPELTMVYSFDISEMFPGVLADVPAVLAWCFQEFNVGEGKHAQEYRSRWLRSLSVGDVVVVGETAWACGHVGWTKITTEQLNNAIIWDDEVNGCPKAIEL
jgi:hypothetical protein